MPLSISTKLVDHYISYIGTEPLFPQLLEKYYLRNSLAGVQPKVSIPNASNIKHWELSALRIAASSYLLNYELQINRSVG